MINNCFKKFNKYSLNKNSKKKDREAIESLNYVAANYLYDCL